MLTDSIGFAKKTLQDNKGFFLQLFTLGFIVNILPLILNHTSDSFFISPLLFGNAIVHFLFFIFIIKLSIHFYDSNKVEISDLFTINIVLYLKLLGAVILIGIMSFLLMILLPIPIIGPILWVIFSIILSVNVCFVVYLIIDDELGPLGAIFESMAIVSGHFGKLIMISFLSSFSGAVIVLVKDGIKELLIQEEISTIYSYFTSGFKHSLLMLDMGELSFLNRFLIKSIDSIFSLCTYIIGSLIMVYIYKRIKGDFRNRMGAKYCS